MGLLCYLAYVEHVVLSILVLGALQTYWRRGFKGVLKGVIDGLRFVPGFNALLNAILRSEASGAVRQLMPQGAADSTERPMFRIPAKGESFESVLAQLEQLKAKENHAEQGKLFGYVYTSDLQAHSKSMKAAKEMFANEAGLSDKETSAFMRQAYAIFSHENALNPTAFPSLRQFETETVSMTATMLNGDSQVVGGMTSGGTESILMCIKTYRDRARALHPHITQPEMVAPITVHPAFEKAAAYFDVKMVHFEVDSGFRGDITSLKKCITSNTILVIVSAPQYPHGIVDPVEAASEIAIANNLPLHVDACFGGFMLPWVEKLGFKVPKWDFRVPGVTSISADIHKYGYGAKGASVLLFRNAELRRHMIYAYAGWPGGLFASPGMAGTRPGGIMAACWASLKTLGEEGYMRIAAGVMETTQKLKDGVRKIDGLQLVGESHMTCFAVREEPGSDVNILVVADLMETRGWKIERQQLPDCLHFSLMPHHAQSADSLLEDLSWAAAEAASNKSLASEGTAAMYGMVAKIPDSSMVDEFLINVFSEIYTPSKQD